ncbi:TetR/AcrR family transcriptional regulator, partial [Streptomyces thermoviolaceus subsp. thermoviolaceus]|nr:TetR/AcrR family transcriptional regulator [Streptomyces thermoviolaceus subsp. thermoviolaceus]
ALLTALQGGLLMTQTHQDTTALEAALDTMIETIRGYATR